MSAARISAPVSSSWRGGVEWLAGSGVLSGRKILETTGPRPALLMDAGFHRSDAGQTVVALLGRYLRRPAGPDRLVHRSPHVEDITTWHKELTELDATGVIAIGGGSVLDLAMLAATPDALQTLPKLCTGRSGLSFIPRRSRHRLPTVALPTTLGTGAEASSAACCQTEYGRHLLLGTGLQPSRALVDPLLTRDLPVRFVHEAMIEILARTIVPLAQQPIGHPAVSDLSDAVAHASLVALSRFLKYPIDAASENGRLGLATISAHTHAGWGQVGRSPFSSPIWFVATELSTVTGMSKVQATACLLPSWATLVAAGERRWGSAARLEKAWESAYADSTRSDVATGLVSLIADLQISPRDPNPLHSEVRSQVLARTLHRWGAGLPMLGGLRAADIEQLLDLALHTAGAEQ